MAAKKISKQPAPSKSGPMQSRMQSRVQSRVKTPAKSSVKTPAKSSASTRRTVVPAPISSSEAQAQLRSLAMNLWWTWNEIAQRPFAALDPVLWNASKHSPLSVLASAGPATLAAACEEPGFRLALADARAALAAELARQTWWAQDCAKANPNTCVAYFCSEFALHESIQQYSGGLGVLAGDHLKSASDLGVPLVWFIFQAVCCPADYAVEDPHFALLACLRAQDLRGDVPLLLELLPHPAHAR